MATCLPWRWITDEALGDESQETIIENFSPYHGNCLAQMTREEAYGDGLAFDLSEYVTGFLSMCQETVRGWKVFLLHFVTTYFINFLLPFDIHSACEIRFFELSLITNALLQDINVSR